MAAVALAAVHPTQANALQIINHSGPMSDLFRFYESVFVMVVGLTGIVGPMSATPNSVFNYRPIFNPDGSPASPWSFTSSPIHYEVRLTTPVPLISGGYNTYQADWYDWYADLGNGHLEQFGGNDNSGGFYQINACEAIKYCAPVTQIGNTSLFGFDDFKSASWGPGGPQYEIHHDWFNGAEVMGRLPTDALDGTYNLEVFATNVPEPATWAMMLVGFAGLGLALRKKTLCISVEAGT